MPYLSPEQLESLKSLTGDELTDFIDGLLPDERDEKGRGKPGYKRDDKVAMWPGPGVMSFAELDQAEAAMEATWRINDTTEQFLYMMNNVMSSDMAAAEKRASMQSLMMEFDERMGSQLEMMGEVADGDMDAMETDDMDKDASSEAGAPDEPRLPEPADVLYKALLESQTDKSMSEGSLSVYKMKDGSWRWHAIYTNNFKDVDFPPDIITKQAHLDFIDMLEKGEVDYPELWHWHIPNTAWGKADYITFVNLEQAKGAGFMFATGYVLPGHENEAASLSKSGPLPIGVSHGMKEIKRDSQNPEQITGYITYEISDLPLKYAANPYTEFLTEDTHA